MMFKINKTVLTLVLLVVANSACAHTPRSEADDTQRPRRVGSQSGKSTEIRSGQNLQAAINSAQCGDRLALQAGATWDGNFLLPNKSCTESNPITITSSGASSLPNGRVSPSDATKMARIRAVVNADRNAAFQAGPNAGWWVLDGLEISDNAGRNTVNALVDLGLSAPGAHDITIQRCYFHQKETGTNYNRSAMRAVWFEGSNLIFKWNHVYLIGYYYPEQVGGSPIYQMDTTAMLSVGGPGPILMEDNYINVWWNGYFLGGGDTPPQNTARLSNASLTQATFSNTTGLTPGVVVRFSLEASGTLSSGSQILVRTDGATVGPTEVGRYIQLAGGNLMRITAVNGNTITVAPQGAIAPDGKCSFSVYETATVQNVNGKLVTFTNALPAFNIDALHQIPQSASWNYGDQGLINDVTVRRNTFEVDPQFAHDVFLKKGYSPKGGFEIKNVNRLIHEGNVHTGYPANWGVTPRNQNGTAPWTTTSHMIFRNNWYAPEDPWAETTGRMAVIALQDDLHTTTPATDIQIYNNFGKNVSSMLQMKGGDGWVVKHNTVLNDGPAKNAYYVTLILEGVPATRFEFSDNIVGYSAYGFNCSIDGNISTCWPGAVLRNNLVVDFANTGLNPGVWGRGGMLTPVRAKFSQIGFTDPANNNYSLSTNSPYKRKASDGKDPGVDMAELQAALAPGSTSQTTAGSQ